MDAPTGKSHLMLPLLIGGGALLFFMASKSSGGATVIGQPAASDIVAANENANNNMTSVMLARINQAGSYYDAKVAADQAIKVAQVNGATATQLQALQNEANVAIAKIQGDTTKVVSQDALTAQLDQDKVAKDESNNAATIAQRQASAQKTTSIVSTIGNIISGALHFFSPTPSTVNMNGVASTGDLVQTIPSPVP